MDELLTSVVNAEGAPTTGRRSARSARVEVITRGERRRVWTPEQKCEIVAESLGSELTPTEVARKHAISSGQLYTWRQQVLGGQTRLLTRTPPRFAQVERLPTTPGPPLDAPGPRPEPARPAALPSAAATASSRLEGLAGGLIEIVLPDGVSVRVDAQVDAQALRRVPGALAGR
jgi:transposase